MVLFPNPVTDVLNIEEANEQEFVVSVFSREGKFCNTSTRSTIDLSILPAGVYLPELKAGKRILHQN